MLEGQLRIPTAWYATSGLDDSRCTRFHHAAKAGLASQGSLMKLVGQSRMSLLDVFRRSAEVEDEAEYGLSIADELTAHD